MYVHIPVMQRYKLYLNSHVGVASCYFGVEKNILILEFPESIAELTV
jgi:hypothetical protein